ncbi:hypothetical protein IEO70_01370 [Bacillus sp. AGMB 02131]|uniref:Uncharacterized protein n=1 Tax=Peribacillus faecalis TaxID=2772559 RepID=A0A927H8Z0_9BACI|nr:hypothetical protein [Peribacillus faecalis]MBD3107015.1 hypothetical protein [Peribacillus faecalis]
MNRYVFTIMLALAGILGISLFYGYVNQTVASPEDFSIETVAGDEKELENVSLAGRLYFKNVPYSLLLSHDQTELNTDSALDWMHTAYVHSAGEIRIKELQKKYRSFMRGKDNTYHLFEDEHFLIYSELDVERAAAEKYEGDIHLSFFDKGKEEGKDFILPLPHEIEKYGESLSLYDIQLLDQEVVLMLYGNQDDVSAVWRVAVNINQEKVVSHTLIHEMESSESAYMSAGNDSLTKEKYMLISEMHDEEKADGTIGTKEKLFAANIESGEMQEISMPDKYQYDEYGLLVDDESIYYIAYAEGTMYKYDFLKDAFEPMWTHDAIAAGNVLLAVKDNRTYLLENGTDHKEGRTEGDINFYVLHTDNGEELYQGRVKGAAETADFNFTIIYPKQFE